VIATSPSPTSSATPLSDPRTANETMRSWLEVTAATASAAAPPTMSSDEAMTTRPQREIRAALAGPCMSAL
jgi:hypothetical protein